MTVRRPALPTEKRMTFAGLALWEMRLPSKQKRGGFDPHSPLHRYPSNNQVHAQMTIGAGIAIAGIWGFAITCALCKQVTGAGFWVGAIAALIGTWFVAGPH